MTMKILIYLLVRSGRFTALPIRAFKSAKKAEEYLKQKEVENKNYHGYIIPITLEDED
nr:MAG TPA: hypothetical protein [Crassvirales sp.]